MSHHEGIKNHKIASSRRGISAADKQGNDPIPATEAERMGRPGASNDGSIEEILLIQIRIGIDEHGLIGWIIDSGHGKRRERKSLY
jgi:hypothetical protein